ncbi:MAG: helix-turn-helix transcriptional regulator [Actinomycetota bacterium]|nr:helix-turn-helix transcriptional regulator [Actinomycetota bacterium]
MLLRDRSAYGAQIIEETGFPSGSVYPALARLHAAGLLVAEDDPDDVRQLTDGRAKRRRSYRLTEIGRSVATSELHRLGIEVPQRATAAQPAPGADRPEHVAPRPWFSNGDARSSDATVHPI